MRKLWVCVKCLMKIHIESFPAVRKYYDRSVNRRWTFSKFQNMTLQRLLFDIFCRHENFISSSVNEKSKNFLSVCSLKSQKEQC